MWSWRGLTLVISRFHVTNQVSVAEDQDIPKRAALRGGTWSMAAPVSLIQGVEVAVTVLP